MINQNHCESCGHILSKENDKWTCEFCGRINCSEKEIRKWLKEWNDEN